MKKILTIIIVLLLLAVALVLVLNSNKITGAWKCTSYTLYNRNTDEWLDQMPEFIENFSLKIYKDGKIIVNAYANETEGEYTFEDDVLTIKVKNFETKYAYSNGKLNLMDHPSAKIEYTRIGKIKEI
jgi:heat shock protein HslJ